MAYSETEAKKLVILAGKKLVEAGLIARTWGNISARISDTEFVITPSGRAYETLTLEEIVKVKIADCSYEGEIRPSSEKGVHAEAYRLRPQVQFVIHTHQVNASALSILGKDLTYYGEKQEQLLGKTIPCAEYGMSSTQKLKRAVAAAIRKHPHSNGVLMRCHGALCMGRDFENAFEISFALEEVCGKLYHEYTSKHFELHDGKTSGDILDIQALQTAICKNGEIGCMLHVKTPYILRMSQEGKEMLPYIDDLAQIAGTSVRSISKEHPEKKIRAALRGRNAVFIQNQGAVCIGSNEEDTQAVAMVLEKGAQAALLAECIPDMKPVNPHAAGLERNIYLNSYSKLKNEKE